MDGVPNRARHRLYGAAALVLLLGGCASLEEIARQSGADPVTWEMRPSATLTCPVPPAADHVHAPGDLAWVGHREQELIAALGPPAFRLGRPQYVADGDDYVVDVYADPQPTRAGCIDAYRRNPCGVITAYACR